MTVVTQPVVKRTSRTLLGVTFVTDPSVPFGDVEWESVLMSWRVSDETYTSLTARSAGMVGSVIQILKQAQKEGRTVVSGVVSANMRRGAVASPRPRPANLDSLTQRCRDLMVQIAHLMDAGPIPDGTMRELSKTYAALQAERDQAYAQFQEIDSNLSIGRAIIIDNAMGG